MTREEAIKSLKGLKARCERLIVSSGRNPEEWRKDAEAVNIAISALHSASRETVEKVWRGEWKLYGAVRGRGGIWRCTRCEDIYPYKNDFCPKCGAPMTDKAVEMVMERLEALKDESKD